jgi:hypothetical protein
MSSVNRGSAGEIWSLVSQKNSTFRFIGARQAPIEAKAAAKESSSRKEGEASARLLSAECSLT